MPQTKTILITPVLPWPSGSGRALRAWDWLQSLAREGPVLVIVVANESKAWSPDDRPYPADVVVYFKPMLQWRWPGLRAWLAAPEADDPSWRLVEAYLGTAPVKTAPIKVVVFRFYLHFVGKAVMARLKRYGQRSISAELDLDDDEAATHWSIAKAEFKAFRLANARSLTMKALCFAAFQRWLSGPYRIAFLAAADDVARFKTRLASSVEVRPNRLPEGYFSGVKDTNMRGASMGYRLLFVGSLQYPPNVQAVEFILDKLLPALKARGVSALEIAVVGRRAAASLEQRLAAEPLVHYHPDVPNVAPFYAWATGALVPVFSGGGSKYKSIEALAAGCPLIATAHGVRGLDLTPGVHYAPADNANAFVDAILNWPQRRGE